MVRVDDSTLMAYADGELDAAAMRGVADALAQDPEAQEKVHQFRLSASLVRAIFRDPAYQQVPPGLAERLTGAAEPSSARRSPWRIAVPLAASIAAAAVSFGAGLTIGVTAFQPDHDFSERLLEEVADYHVVYAREDEHQVEVPASRTAHIEAWLGERLHRDLHIPVLSDRGLMFQGARLLVVDGQPVAQLLYDWPNRKQSPLALCISFGGPGETELRTYSRQGVNLALWHRKGYTYVLVGWVDKAFLRSLAAELTPTLDAL